METATSSSGGCVVILEDNPARIALMDPILSEILPQFDHRFFANAPDMIAWLAGNLARVVFISLDHDLDSVVPVSLQAFDPGCGLDVVDCLAKFPPVCPVIVHTSNADAGMTMLFRLRDAGWFASRVYPRDGMDWIAGDWAHDIRALVERRWIF
ncbi:MAG TPA: cyclic-phosphate processing receiver domain-containing protein [Tepidisphaeraceae bacterium]|jgi:hypothetical protein|nr:cyclic-phosphate processing receiver domain-containing protein [Tepidisphaeraceae bacterium]